MTDRTPTTVAPGAHIPEDQRQPTSRASGAPWPFRLGSDALLPLRGFVFALVATVVTLGIRLALDRELEGQPTLVIFTLPIMISAYAGGLSAGLWATGLSTALACYFVLAPIFSFRVASIPERWQLFFVVVAGVVISVLNEVLHRTRRRVTVATHEQQQAEDSLREAGTLQSAIFNSANFSSIATDAKGVIQIFNVGAERMLGYTAADVVDRITPAEISDPQEIIARATALSLEFGTPITPGFEALVFKATRGIEDIYELTYIRKDRSRFPAVVSVTALRDRQDAIIGYLLIGTDNTARKQAEKALLETGALQRAIFNSVHFSSIATDAAGVIQIFNVGAERMMGYTAAEVVNRATPADFHDPDEVRARATALSLEFGTPIAPGFEALTVRAAHGIEDIYELTKIRKDGSRFPAIVSVTALRDAQNAIIGYLLIGTDNTARHQVDEERKRAEEARRVSETRYRALFDWAPDGIIIADSERVYLDANASICRMLGYTHEEMIGLHASDIVTETETHRIGPTLDMQRRAGADNREWQFRRKDGSVFDADVIAATMPDGNLLGMIRDVTDRKRADDQTARVMRELNDLKAAIDIHGIVAVTDAKGKITHVNDKFCAISQFTRAELIGQDHRIINSGFHPKEFIRGIWQTILDGRVWQGEIKDKAKDGTFFWVDTTIVPYLGEDGKAIQYIAIRGDITERKAFEWALQEKNVELEDASRLKSEFLANMSHELRTPLNAIVGFSEVLKDGLLGEMTEQQRRFIGDIFGSGTHLLSLINDILDLSKVEAGKMTLELEAVDVSTLCVNSLSILREKAGKNHIRLNMSGVEALGLIQVDGRKLKQILYNLLSNAVKFSAEGGEVTLRAGRVPRAAVGRLSDVRPGRSLPLALSEFEEFVQIDVTDDGIGISPEGLEQLFKPFSQIDSGLARKFEGTGLGLAMVKLLAELHGGTMAVHSAVGEGSRFTVWLPLRRAADRAPDPVDANRVPGWAAIAGVPVALVVEGDMKSAGLIRVQLEAEGFAVLHAASAEDALAVAMLQPLALITLDIMLPGMDGWEFLSRIKQMPALRRIPVVIISIVADRNRGFALGAAAVMEKPISRLELYESLADLGVSPLAPGQSLRVLVVDDDPTAVDLVALRIGELASTVLHAYGGREAIEVARRELPDVILLDLMMPDVNGFDVVEALKSQADTARIPILVVTAKQITAEDRATLNRYVATIMEKSTFDRGRFTAEVRRAMSGRQVAT